MRSSDLTCREFVELVTDYHERALPAGERIRVEQHLLVCSACTRYDEQIRATISAVGAVQVDGLGPESWRALLDGIEGWLARRQ